jgi:hypothetical protein
MSEQRKVGLIEELRIEGSLVPHRRGELYRLAADALDRAEAVCEAAQALLADSHETADAWITLEQKVRAWEATK